MIRTLRSTSGPPATVTRDELRTLKKSRELSYALSLSTDKTSRDELRTVKTTAENILEDLRRRRAYPNEPELKRLTSLHAVRTISLSHEPSKHDSRVVRAKPQVVGEPLFRCGAFFFATERPIGDEPDVSSRRARTLGHSRRRRASFRARPPNGSSRPHSPAEPRSRPRVLRGHDDSGEDDRRAAPRGARGKGAGHVRAQSRARRAPGGGERGVRKPNRCVRVLSNPRRAPSLRPTPNRTTRARA